MFPVLGIEPPVGPLASKPSAVVKRGFDATPPIQSLKPLCVYAREPPPAIRTATVDVPAAASGVASIKITSANGYALSIVE